MPAVFSQARLAVELTQAASAILSGTSGARPNNGVSQILWGYGDTGLGTITTTSTTPNALLETDGTGDSMFIGIVEAGDGAQTTDWTSGASSALQLGLEVYAGGVSDPSSVFLECTAIKRVANMDSQTWPSVTPTRENQVVICFWGYSDNTGYPVVDPTSYGGSTYFAGGNASNSAGADSAVGYFAFRDPPVGVPFTPATNTASSGLSGTLVTMLLDSWELPHPQMVLGACSTTALFTTLTMPDPALVNDIALDGDVFFIASVPWGTGYTPFTNASWLDDQEVMGGGYLGWKRLVGDAGYDPAWTSSPPQTTASLNRGHGVWGLIRGLQRTGAIRLSAGSAGGPSFINYWTDVPVVGSDGEFIVLQVQVTADPGGFNFPNQPRSQQPIRAIGTSGRSGILTLASDDWIPGSPGTEVDADWVFNRTPAAYWIHFQEASLTWFTEAPIVAPATVSTVMTAEVGARFVESQVVAPATLDTSLIQTRVRLKKPRRPLVWIHGLDQVRKNVLD
jgi:hypothetical protein